MSTYTETLTLGEFETMHALTQTITPKAERWGASLLEMMHLQRPVSHELIIQTTDRYRAGRLVSRRELGEVTPDLYLPRETIETAARLIKADYGSVRTDADTPVARIEWDTGEEGTQNQTATIMLNNGTVLQSGEMESKKYPALGKLFERDSAGTPAGVFHMQADKLATLAKLRTPERGKPAETKWKANTPREREGSRNTDGILFSVSGPNWNVDYLAQPMAGPSA